MRSYLSLIPASAKVRRRQNRMTLICIAIAVFLVTGVFSMVDAALAMEKHNLIVTHGYWHIALKNISENTAEQIAKRSDVKTLTWCDMINPDVNPDYFIGNKSASLYGVDSSWLTDVFDGIKEGTFPKTETDVMLSPNAKSILQVQLGDSITINTPAGTMEYTISGFGAHDLTGNQLNDSITVYMNKTTFLQVCKQLKREAAPSYHIRFRSDSGTTKKIKTLKAEYNLTDKNIDENTGLLAITGYSSNQYAKSIYSIAALLFVLILIAGVLMIASSMNSNVSQRTQFFGMMRCIGMIKKQVIRFVRFEALNWCKISVPIGILCGIVAAWGLCGWLKYGIRGEFTELPIFHLSPIGIVLGAVTGVLTVCIAAQSPAKRAAKVSPVAAVSGNASQLNKQFRPMKIGRLKIETTLGIHHAVSAKKNLILMTCSFALSIILFFCFSAGLDFVTALLPSIRSWQPECTISAKDDKTTIPKSLVDEISKVPGLKHVYGNMIAMKVPSTLQGNEEKLTLVSYEDYMFNSAKKEIVEGDISKITADSNYVLAIYNPKKPFHVGDQIQMNGSELEVAAIVSDGIFSSDATIISTETTFARVMKEASYSLVSMQFIEGQADDALTYIRSILPEKYLISDFREDTSSNVSEFWAFRIIVYTFLAIITFIAILNIMNSTAMSVASRTRQYGAMRAVGMDVTQLTKMIAAEVFTYAASGCVVGCVIGLLLNKLFFETFITAYFGEPWKIPVVVILLILVVVLSSVVIAVYSPAKRMCSMAITETINEL